MGSHQDPWRRPVAAAKPKHAGMKNTVATVIACLQIPCLVKRHCISGAFHYTYPTAFAVVIINVPLYCLLLPSYCICVIPFHIFCLLSSFFSLNCQIRAEKAAVVALVAETAVKAAFCLTDGETCGYFEIDFGKGTHPL